MNMYLWEYTNDKTVKLKRGCMLRELIGYSQKVVKKN